MSPKPRKSNSKDFEQVLEELVRGEAPFSPVNLYHFSDLERKGLDQLEAVWPSVPVGRRRQLLEDLGELAEANIEVNFDAVSLMALEDEDSQIRAAAIHNLWETEDPGLIAPLLRFLDKDPAAAVRAAAAEALGTFVYLHALEELPPTQGKRLEDALISAATGADEPEVRRRAIESLGFSERPEVPPILEAAYHSESETLKASALFAMSRSADARWKSAVVAELNSPSPALRLEAARAAGELELGESVPLLTELLDDADTQVRDAAIWSLSQVGGAEARRALNDMLERAAGDEETEFLTDALDNLEFTDDLNQFMILDVDPNEDEDEPSRKN